MTGSQTRTAVDIHELEITHSRTRILDSITATIYASETPGPLGPSGCRETTLMHAITGAQRIRPGSITVFGRRTEDRSLCPRIGYVSQDTAVYSDLSVLDNVAYFATLMGAGRAEAQTAIELVGLVKCSRQLVSNLSGGQCSHASTVCTLVAGPKFLALNKPTVSLDPPTREVLQDASGDLARQGHTFIISSHATDEVMRYDRLILMREEHILGILTSDELLKKAEKNSSDAAFLALVHTDAENKGNGA